MAKSKKKRTVNNNTKRRLRDFQRGMVFGYLTAGIGNIIAAEYDKSPWLRRLGVTKQDLANEAVAVLCDELGVKPLTRAEAVAYDVQLRHIHVVVSQIMRTRQGLNSIINGMAKQKLSYEERKTLT